MSDYFCHGCNVYRIRTDKDALVCPSCADMVYPLHQPVTSASANAQLPSPKCGFRDSLDFFAGMDSMHAPIGVLALVRDRVPENFTKSDVESALPFAYKRFYSRVYDTLLVVKEAKARGATSVPQVRGIISELKVKGCNKIAPKIARLACRDSVKMLTGQQERNILAVYDKAKRAFDEIREEGDSMLRFQYVMYKICQILEYDEFLRDITLPGKRSLIGNDARWSRICSQAQLEFRPTAPC